MDFIQQAIALSKDVEDILRSKPLSSIPTDLSLMLPEGMTSTYFHVSV